MLTFDKAVIDSLGAFLRTELIRLDPMLYAPLSLVTWSRDIDLRNDVVLADASTAFMRTRFGSFGAGISNVSWSSKKATGAKDISVDSELKTAPLRDVEYGLSYSIRELAASQALGRPIDAQKLQGLQLKYQLDVDQVVYIGDASFGFKGLVNHDDVTVTPAATGSGGGTVWSGKTPEEIRNDINAVIRASWTASGYAVCPHKILLPPEQYALIVETPFNEYSDRTIADFVKGTSLAANQNGAPLEIVSCKWLSGAGTGGKDRIVAYTQREEFVRYPLVPLAATPVTQHGTEFDVTYYGTLGEIEIVYPTTLAYCDGV